MALYLVPVPIGNLEDITLRAIKVLQNVDFVIAEDTRYSLKLLNHLEIKKRMCSYYKPKEHEKAGKIIKELLEGKDGALITDSGSPCISDPGNIVVKLAIERGIDIIPLPGPTAFVPALSASGLDTETFFFKGFGPRKKGELIKFLEEVKELSSTLIFYESPKRVKEFLKHAYSVFQNRNFALVKELSKKNEKFIRGNLQNYEAIVEGEVLLGEFVILIEGLKDKPQESDIELNCLEDIYTYFLNAHGIPRNRIKQIFMTRNEK